MDNKKLLYLFSSEQSLEGRLNFMLSCLERHDINYTKVGNNITVDGYEYQFRTIEEKEEIRGMRYSEVVIDEFTR